MRPDSKGDHDRPLGGNIQKKWRFIPIEHCKTARNWTNHRRTCQVDRELAETAARRRDSLVAMVRAGLEAAATDDRVEALALALRQVEVALHPAVYPGNDGSPVAPPSGDEIAKVL